MTNSWSNDWYWLCVALMGATECLIPCVSLIASFEICHIDARHTLYIKLVHKLDYLWLLSAFPTQPCCRHLLDACRSFTVFVNKYESSSSHVPTIPETTGLHSCLWSSCTPIWRQVFYLMRGQTWFASHFRVCVYTSQWQCWCNSALCRFGGADMRHGGYVDRSRSRSPKSSHSSNVARSNTGRIPSPSRS